ncbi:DUF5993 family protein [Bartonella sp. B30(2025)]
MFIPFLIAFSAAVATVYGKKNLSYVLWIILLAAILLIFKQHATSVLNLSF